MKESNLIAAHTAAAANVKLKVSDDHGAAAQKERVLLTVQLCLASLSTLCVNAANIVMARYEGDGGWL